MALICCCLLPPGAAPWTWETVPIGRGSSRQAYSKWVGLPGSNLIAKVLPEDRYDEMFVRHRDRWQAARLKDLVMVGRAMAGGWWAGGGWGWPED